MTDPDPRGPAPTGVSVALAVVIGVTCLLTFAVLGLGMLSYFTDVDIISVQGLGLWPAVIAMAVALAVHAIGLRAVLSAERPRFGSATMLAVLVVIAHHVALWLSALIVGVGVVHAATAVSQLVVRGSTLVLLAAALLGGWVAVGLRRAPGGTPQWPWERAEDE